ncbi:MAG TPA: hypothetical protein VJC13_00140 [Candidatus Paceibacterota bacterium]
MSQVQILIGAGIAVHSFVDGARVSRPKLRETEVDALAHALWLENHGQQKRALKYLEEYLQRNRGNTCHLGGGRGVIAVLGTENAYAVG